MSRNEIFGLHDFSHLSGTKIKNVVFGGTKKWTVDTPTPHPPWGGVSVDVNKERSLRSFKEKLTSQGAVVGPKIASESKNAIFPKSKIMIPQSNLGKRKVKLMLVRP